MLHNRRVNAYLCSMDAFKEKLVEQARFVLQRKIELISFSIDELKISMENEAKSSAGDKHETARAKMQAEEEKLSYQLLELKNQALEFERTNFDEDGNTVKPGNLIETNNGLFLISIPLGKIEVEGKSVYVISLVSPLAQAMKGLAANVKFEFNKVMYEILSLC